MIFGMPHECFSSSGTCQPAAPSAFAQLQQVLSSLALKAPLHLILAASRYCIRADGFVHLRPPLSNTAPPNAYRTTQRLKINTKGSSPLQRRGMQQLLWEKRKCAVWLSRLQWRRIDIGFLPDQETTNFESLSPTSCRARIHFAFLSIRMSSHFRNIDLF